MGKEKPKQAKSKIVWNSDKFLSLTALFVSLCTLCVFVYQTSLIRKQQFMSVYPHLSMGNKGMMTDDYSYILMNSGIGPAMIKEVKVTYKGKVIDGDLSDYIDSVIQDSAKLYYGYSSIMAGRLIPAGEMIEMITSNTGDDEGMLKLQSLLNDDDLLFEITYESIYEESYRSTNLSQMPVKLD